MKSSSVLSLCFVVLWPYLPPWFWVTMTLARLSQFEANKRRKLFCLQHGFPLGRHYTAAFPEA